MIETYDLSKKFDEFQAVDGVTLTVKPGQILALLGQNGAGKTTTVRMLTALLRPSRGHATVNGYDVVKQSSDVRASVGVLTEQHGLYYRMTGEEYLEFFGQVYRLKADMCRTRINYLMEYFGLAHAAHQRIGEYSKGMKQKLALARAMIHEPPVLLLDEPTSAMDPESARLVRDEISNLKSSQRTIVICTHNLAEAEALADEIAIIYRGRILQKGKLQDLQNQVLGPVEYKAKLSGSWNGQFLSLPDDVELSENQGNMLRFRVKQPELANPKIMHELMTKGAQVVTFEEVPHTLEQIYLKVMEDAQSRGNS